jgi:hypothetical protein
MLEKNQEQPSHYTVMLHVDSLIEPIVLPEFDEAGAQMILSWFRRNTNQVLEINRGDALLLIDREKTSSVTITRSN